MLSIGTKPRAAHRTWTHDCALRFRRSKSREPGLHNWNESMATTTTTTTLSLLFFFAHLDLHHLHHLHHLHYLHLHLPNPHQAAPPPRRPRRDTPELRRRRAGSAMATLGRGPNTRRGPRNTLPLPARGTTRSSRCLLLSSSSTTGRCRRRGTGRARRCMPGELQKRRILRVLFRFRGGEVEEKRRKRKNAHPLLLFPLFFKPQTNFHLTNNDQGPAERQRLPGSLPADPVLLLSAEPLRRKSERECESEREEHPFPSFLSLSFSLSLFRSLSLPFF